MFWTIWLKPIFFSLANQPRVLLSQFFLPLLLVDCPDWRPLRRLRAPPLGENFRFGRKFYVWVKILGLGKTLGFGENLGLGENFRFVIFF